MDKQSEEYKRIKDDITQIILRGIFKADETLSKSPIKELLELWERAGYDLSKLAILDDDQSLPKPRFPNSALDDYIREGQQDMKDENWRRVI